MLFRKQKNRDRTQKIEKQKGRYEEGHQAFNVGDRNLKSDAYAYLMNTLLTKLSPTLIQN